MGSFVKNDFSIGRKIYFYRRRYDSTRFNIVPVVKSPPVARRAAVEFFGSISEAIIAFGGADSRQQAEIFVGECKALDLAAVVRHLEAGGTAPVCRRIHFVTDLQFFTLKTY